jgi:hypothetical protein
MYVEARVCSNRVIYSIGFDNRSHVVMVMGDPAIGDSSGPPNDYQRGATFQTFYPYPCPVCGCTLTERAIVELYITPIGLHMQLLIIHHANELAGNSVGCYWSVPVNGQTTAPRVGPIVHRVIDAQPSHGET